MPVQRKSLYFVHALYQNNRLTQRVNSAVKCVLSVKHRGVTGFGDSSRGVGSDSRSTSGVAIGHEHLCGGDGKEVQLAQRAHSGVGEEQGMPHAAASGSGAGTNNIPIGINNTIHTAIAVWEWPSMFDMAQKLKGVRLDVAAYRRPDPACAPVLEEDG